MRKHDRPRRKSRPVAFVDSAGTFDLPGRDADPITFLQHLFTMSRQSIHSDQVVASFTRLHLLCEQLFDGSAWLDVDVVGETGSIIVDLC